MKTPADRIAQAQAKLWKQFPTLRPPAPAAIPEPGRLAFGWDQHGSPMMAGQQLMSGHLDVVGAIGSGKSTFLRGLATQFIDSDPRLRRALVQIDPHGHHDGSLHRSALRHIVKTEVYKKKPVYVIDANSAWCSGIMLLDSRLGASVVADQLIECFERIRDDDDLNKTPTLRRGLHGNLAALTELGLTLAEADVLIDPRNGALREWALTQITDRYARKALQRLESLSGDPRLRSELEIETVGQGNRLAPVLASPPMRAIVGTPTIDMVSVLDKGGIVLVNAGGGDHASELAGDLLGKLVVRSVVVAGKRRRGDSLALLIADESPRYVTRDFERALAELRKFRVAVVAAHQTYAMLGLEGDPVREAIEKIPATRVVFRMASMQEAAVVAPEVLHLDLETPIKVLTKPVVVGHRRIWLGNSSRGINAAFNAGLNASMSRGANQSTTNTRGSSAAQSQGEQHTATRSRSHTRSESETDQEGWSKSETDQEGWNESKTEAENWSDTHTDAKNFSTTNTESDMRTTSSGRSGSRGSSDSSDSGTGETFSYDRNNTNRMRPDNTTESTNGGSGSSASTEQGWNNSDGRTAGTSDSTQWGYASSNAHSQGGSHARTSGQSGSHAWTTGESGSHSRTTGEADTTGTSDAYGTSRTNTTGRNANTGATIGTNTSFTGGLSAGFSFGGSATTGKSEALEPIFKNMAGGVHSLQNVQHMQAERLCTLPTGVAVVRTIKDGKIEGAIVRVPERACRPVSDAQYAADLQLVMEHGGGLPMHEAIRQVEEREHRLLAHARAIKAQAQAKPKTTTRKEANGFRVSGERWKNNPQRNGAHNGGRKGTVEN